MENEFFIAKDGKFSIMKIALKSRKPVREIETFPSEMFKLTTTGYQQYLF